MIITERFAIVGIKRWMGQYSTSTTKDKMEAGVKMKPRTSNAKLPKLKLKTFGGDPLCFQSFWDTFESAVDNDKSLDNITKFTYLRGQALFQCYT